MATELIDYTELPKAREYPATELVQLTPEQLDQRVDTLVGEVQMAREWLGDREAALRRAQRVRNARARRQRSPALAPTFDDL